MLYGPVQKLPLRISFLAAQRADDSATPSATGAAGALSKKCLARPASATPSRQRSRGRGRKSPATRSRGCGRIARTK